MSEPGRLARLDVEGRVAELAQQSIVIAGRYRVLEELGRGGIGRVLRVEHVHTGARLAMKILLAHAGMNADLVERFKREARAPSLIRSEHVVRVTDADVAPELDGAPFLVMELLEGTDLEKFLIQRVMLPLEEVVPIIEAIARGLEAAHAVGIVHRDLKPANVFLHRFTDGGSVVKILDFGISKMANVARATTGETSAGVVLGTPRYMAPEQARGLSDQGPSVDVWALGVMTFRLLAGRHYFSAPLTTDVVVQIVSGPMPPPSELVAGLPPGFDAWFFRSCARDPAARFPSASAQAAALAALLGEVSSVVSRPPETAMMPTAPAPAMPVARASEPAGPVASERVPPTRRSDELRGGRFGDARSPGSSGERRQLTIVYVKTSVAPVHGAGEADPEELAAVLHEHDDACTKVLAAFGVPVRRPTVDRLFIYFGYPIAHGDDARRAVLAARGIGAATARLRAQVESRTGITIRAQIGVQTGLVVVDDSRRDPNGALVVGQAPQVAAQLAGLAGPDEVVIGGSTHALVRRDFACEPLVDGTGPADAYRVVSAQSPEISGTLDRGALVGRDAELALLRDRFEEVSSGVGQVAMISADPGFGKSRLLRELRSALTRDGRPFRWIEARCSPYFTNTAFHPLVDVVERLAELAPDDDANGKRAKLTELARSFALPGEAEILLGALIGVTEREADALNLSPSLRKERTLETLHALLGAVGAKQPLCFVVEDLHWIDPSTNALLSALVGGSSRSGIFLVMSARTTFVPSWPGRTPILGLHLAKLPPKRVEALVRELAGGKRVPAELVERIVARTDGVPLFVEELTKMVLESGVVREEPDAWVLTAPLRALAIPSTLRDSLTARLDQLGPTKATAQLAATIGREFSYELLRAISPLDEETLHRDLQMLVECELVHQRGALPQATYVFKHNLVQEAAYESLLKNHRRQAHRSVAEKIVQISPATAQREPEVLARHHAAAGSTAAAVGFYVRAGQAAIARSAYAEAIGHLSTAIELVETLPDGGDRIELELAARSLLGASLMYTRGYGAPEVETTYARAVDLGRRAGRGPRLVPLLFGLWLFYLVRGVYRTAYDVAEQLRALAAGPSGDDAKFGAHLSFGSTLVHFGRFGEAIEHLDACIARYEPDRHRRETHLYGHEPGVFAHIFRGWALWMVGRAEEAFQSCNEAIRLAELARHPNSLGFSLGMTAIVYQWQRDPEMAQVRAAECARVSEEQGLVHWLALGRMIGGWSRVQKGDVVGGLRELREARERWGQIGARVSNSHWDAMLADACRVAGDVEGALAAIADGRRFVEASGDLLVGPELDLIEAELVAGTDPTRARGLLERAALEARETGARTFEARAVARLEKLRR